MEEPYRITINAVKEFLPEWEQKLTRKIESVGLSDRVLILIHELYISDYGVNPIADSDERPYIMIKNPQRKEIFQISDIIIKSSNYSKENQEGYMNFAVLRISNDLKNK